MRVLAAAVVAPHMAVSGAVTAATEHSRALARHCAIELAVMAPADGVVALDGLTVRRLRARLPGGPLLARAPNTVRTPLYRSTIPELVRRGGFDLVHLHNPLPALELARIAAAARKAGLPVVLSAHGFVEIGSGGTAYGLSMFGRAAWQVLVERPVRTVVRHAAAVLATSPADGEVALRFGCPPERLHTVPNGVHLPPPGCLSDAQSHAVAVRFGFAEDLAQGRPILFFLANHTPNKGLPDLLAAAARVAAPHTLVVGGSRRDHVDYAGQGGDRGGGRRTVFTGLLDAADKDALFRLADLFVFPSRADTFPLVVLEAMSHSLPVLATRVGGIPWQVTDGVTGRLVAPGDVATLATALDALLADRGQLAAMGAAGRADVRARFTWDRAAAETAAIYRSVLKAR